MAEMFGWIVVLVIFALMFAAYTAVAYRCIRAIHKLLDDEHHDERRPERRKVGQKATE